MADRAESSEGDGRFFSGVESADSLERVVFQSLRSKYAV
jgi:hypothetical protein